MLNYSCKKSDIKAGKERKIDERRIKRRKLDVQTNGVLIYTYRVYIILNTGNIREMGIGDIRKIV